MNLYSYIKPLRLAKKKDFDLKFPSLSPWGIATLPPTIMEVGKGFPQDVFPLQVRVMFHFP